MVGVTSWVFEGLRGGCCCAAGNESGSGEGADRQDARCS